MFSDREFVIDTFTSGLNQVHVSFFQGDYYVWAQDELYYYDQDDEYEIIADKEAALARAQTMLKEINELF